MMVTPEAVGVNIFNTPITGTNKYRYYECRSDTNNTNTVINVVLFIIYIYIYYY